MRRHIISEGLLLCSVTVMCLVQVCMAELPDPPTARSRREITSVLAKASSRPSFGRLKQLNVVLIADKKDHGPHEHDYPLWQKRWQTLLSRQESGPVNLYGPPQENLGSGGGAGPIQVTTAQQWPSSEQFASADVIVVFCYITWDAERLAQLRAYLNRGGGLVLVHSATWTRPALAKEVGEVTSCGGFNKYRHGRVTLKIADPNHPVCMGLPGKIAFVDESYWPPLPKMESGARHILATSDEKMSEDSAAVRAQPMFWTYEHGKGRVFVCVPGHYTWTFDDPYFRLLLLRGIAWSGRQWPYRFDALAANGVRLSD
jgi:type 1 glutamine amidotransferase